MGCGEQPNNELSELLKLRDAGLIIVQHSYAQFLFAVLSRHGTRFTLMLMYSSSVLRTLVQRSMSGQCKELNFARVGSRMRIMKIPELGTVMVKSLAYQHPSTSSYPIELMSGPR